MRFAHGAYAADRSRRRARRHSSQGCSDICGQTTHDPGEASRLLRASHRLNVLSLWLLMSGLQIQRPPEPLLGPGSQIPASVAVPARSPAGRAARPDGDQWSAVRHHRRPGARGTTPDRRPGLSPPVICPASNLAVGRRWHFFFACVRHQRADLPATNLITPPALRPGLCRDQLTPRATRHDIVEHAPKFPGDEARATTPQKFAYLAIVLIVSFSSRSPA